MIGKKKKGFIFTIRRARKASRKDAITGRSVTLSFRRILGALDVRFLIHYFTRDSAPHWYVIPILSRAFYTPVSLVLLFAFYAALIYALHNAVMGR